MATACPVETPRINANEDQVQVIGVPVADGQSVAADDLLVVLETTKAAVDVLAPRAGIVRGLRAKVGDFVTVGDLLCEIVDPGDVADGAQPVVATSQVVSITAKARRIADELGIDLALVAPVDGRIGQAEVLAAHRPASPSIRQWQSASPTSRRAVIMGGGGHAACLIDALADAGYELIGCVDQARAVGAAVADGVTVIGDEALLETLRADGVAYAFVGVGGAEDSRVRRLLFERLTAMGFEIPPIVHRDARIASGVRFGRGCHVLAGATVGARCTIGENVIVNQGSIVCHDSVVHDHVHITPGAILAGAVTIGPRTVVGMGASVLLGTTIGADCLIHNGAQIVSDVADATIVDGNGNRRRRPPLQNA